MNNTSFRLRIGRGPLVIITLFLIMIFTLGYRYFQEMKQLHLQVQTEAQLLSTQAIAKVLHERSDLFFYSSELDSEWIEKSSLNVFHLRAPITLNGYKGDWDITDNFFHRYSQDSALYAENSSFSQPLAFNLLLGERAESLYGFVAVEDSQLVFRDPLKYRRLDNSDHIRLILKKDGLPQRYVLVASQPGEMTAFEVHEDWRHAVTGEPEYQIKAFLKPSKKGYRVEFQLPYDWVGFEHRLVVMVVDVNDSYLRQVETVIGTLPTQWSGELNQLIILSYPLQKILAGLERLESTRICVVDRYQRVRTATPSMTQTVNLCDKNNEQSVRLIDAALAGTSQVVTYQRKNEQGIMSMVIASAEPVFLKEEIIGAVLLEKDSQDILTHQRKSLDRLAYIIIAVVMGIFFFIVRLSFRILRLSSELNSVINSEGRLVKTDIQSEKDARDDLGDLSRGATELLGRLGRYTHFLETIPRTLRHEILNPVNAISLGLQQLETSPEKVTEIVRKTKRSILQLELIVSRLTEAAHIEEALATDVIATIDLAYLLGEYVENIRQLHPAVQFNYSDSGSEILIQGNDLRFVQLLDKIKDNAINHLAQDGSIDIVLGYEVGWVSVTISNDGPPVSDSVLKALFTGIIPRQNATVDSPHLGIGLYIAYHIIQSHRGHIHVSNRLDGSGVSVVLTLPAA
ncbi:MAG: ATP-binding protein [Methylococcales bacterium]|nr:ATP-binding protein [Methylococcales bacterium]